MYIVLTSGIVIGLYTGITDAELAKKKYRADTIVMTEPNSDIVKFL